MNPNRKSKQEVEVIELHINRLAAAVAAAYGRLITPLQTRYLRYASGRVARTHRGRLTP